MEETGYLDGSKMAMAFNMLRASDLIWPYVVNNYLKGQEPSAFDLLFWNSDSTRMPAANHSFYLRNCYLQNNALTKGAMVLAGKTISLGERQNPDLQSRHQGGSYRPGEIGVRRQPVFRR
jgi:polyhydroxyalkanoate synthase